MFFNSEIIIKPHQNNAISILKSHLYKFWAVSTPYVQLQKMLMVAQETRGVPVTTKIDLVPIDGFW